VRVRASGGLGGASPVEQAATAIDPVCGMEVTADESSRPLEHDGTTYYFCCPGCRAAFAADPESYTRSVHADQE
jgi:xanthine dehydrogenase accessory factor